MTKPVKLYRIYDLTTKSYVSFSRKTTWIKRKWVFFRVGQLVGKYLADPAPGGCNYEVHVFTKTETVTVLDFLQQSNSN
jgi:hypothetical protein